MRKINFYNETDYNVDEFIEKIKYTLDFTDETHFTMNIIFVDNNRIQEINRDYRNIDRITDVISFANCDIENPLLNPHNDIGDIFICIDRAKEQSVEYGHSLIREIVFLSVHGYLHLNGYDHMTEKDEKEMFSLQELILSEQEITR
jgi:probable rRNA maturation factor